MSATQTQVDPNLLKLFADDPPRYETVNVVAGLNDAVWETMPQSEWESLFADPPPQTSPDQSDPAHLGAVCEWLNRNGYAIRMAHAPGHHIYPKGCWALHNTGRGEGRLFVGDIIRYFDQTQMVELSAMFKKGFNDEFMALLEGQGVKEGPERVGKPPIDPFGNPIVERNDGNHGSLEAECKWIEEHDNVFVQYLGTDENWPDGCWAIEGDDPEPQLLDPEQVKYVAHVLLGMPGRVNERRQLGDLLLRQDDPPDPLQDDDDLLDLFADPQDKSTLCPCVEDDTFHDLLDAFGDPETESVGDLIPF